MFAVSKAAQAVSSAVLADAIDFDGTNDYLSRSSDLVGNADGKTFTFSAWILRTLTNQRFIYRAGASDAAPRLDIYTNTDSSITVDFYNSSGSNILRTTIANSAPLNTFSNFLISVDLTNAANRHVYINDVQQSVTWTTYLNDSIDFTNTNHVIGDVISTAGFNYGGRLAHVFLDYTYRNLSVEANRRLFITADRKPAANQSALNPILYLPLNDPTQPGKNLGTGGDFTLTGVVARSGRGPSQFNAPYSDLNGTSQYLSRSSIAGIADGKQFTVSCSINHDHVSGGGSDFGSIVSFGSGTSYRFLFEINTSRNLLIAAYDSTGTCILLGQSASGTIVGYRNYHIVVSVNLADSSSRRAYVNGQELSITWSIYTNSNINFSIGTTPRYFVGVQNDLSGYLNGRLGNAFFDTKYIDLSQPANLAKFVTGTGIDAKPADLGANGELPFGTPPLIYLPMYGNNAGKNYGTGGDFTVNSGPFPGARGPNEFWGNKAAAAGAGHLERNAALSGVTNGKTFSMSFWISPNDSANGRMFFGIAANTYWSFIAYRENDNYLYIEARNSSNTRILTMRSSSTVTANNSYFVQLSVDLTSTSRRSMYINDVLQSTVWTNYVNDTIVFNGDRYGVFAYWDGIYTSQWNGKLSEFYFTTDYIDFSQEANRLKFRDAFGNPVDLAQQIAAGTLPNPAIYMRFDPSNFGKNSGTGGDFTVAGTITDGGNL